MIALYIVLGIIGLLLLLLFIAVIRTLFIKTKEASYDMSKDTKRIDEYADKLSKMIQYETVSIRDVEQVEKFRGFHKLLESLFPNVFNTCEKIEIDGNLMMKWKGIDSKLDPIILISHQDVVEATGKWIYPPFSGKIVDGRIYGRGACDIKSGVFSFYQAVDELIASGYKPKCDVYLGSSCTEEIGGDGAPKMVNWFKERNINLFLLSDEGGGIVENPVAGVKGAFAAVGLFEKGYGDLKFIARSNGGHSSTPKKNTPIPKLAAFINRVEKKEIFKVKFSTEVEEMFKSIAPYTTNFGLRLVMSNLWLFKPLLKLVLPLISSEAAAMLKTTCCFTMQKGSDGYNVIPQEAYVTANLRYIPHQGMNESNDLISKLAKKYDLDTEIVVANDASTPVSVKNRPFKMTEECIRKVFPKTGIMPYVVTGGTDSRFFDPVCKNCIRFSPTMICQDQMGGMHGLNENIFAAVLPNAVDYYKELIKIQETR